MYRKVLIYIFSFLLITLGCTKEKSLPEYEKSAVKLHFNEIMTFDSPAWIEIYNPGDTDIYLEAYHLIYNDQQCFTIKSSYVPAKGFYLFFCDGADFVNHTNFIIANKGGNLKLTDADNRLIDVFSFPVMNNSVSYGSMPDGSTNFVFMSKPSPITTNTPVYIPNKAPTITDVLQLPEFPAAYQIVTVDAFIKDDYAIDTALFYYSYDGFDTVVGFHPSCCDARKMAAEIIGLPAGSIVSYYIKATDDSSSVSFYPLGAPFNKISYTVLP